MIHGKQVWCEDDALRQINDPDRETIYTEWLKRFGESFDQKNAVVQEDGGDHFLFLMPNGYVACSSYDGWYLYEPATDKDRIEAAIKIAAKTEYSERSHLVWIIDQVVRILAGDRYEDVVKEACGDEYEWDCGIAP